MKTYNKPQVEVKELRSLGILMASGEPSPAPSANAVTYAGVGNEITGD